MIIASERMEVDQKLKKWEVALTDSPELFDTLIGYVKEMENKQIELQLKENEISNFLEYKGEKITFDKDNIQIIIKFDEKISIS